jgi:hypothetical protein
VQKGNVVKDLHSVLELACDRHAPPPRPLNRMTADLFRVVTPIVEQRTSQRWMADPRAQGCRDRRTDERPRAALVHESASSGCAGHAPARLTRPPTAATRIDLGRADHPAGGMVGGTFS